MSFTGSAGRHEFGPDVDPSVEAGRDYPDIFISGDVETDGPIPGEFSLLSFGLALIGSFDGNEFKSAQADEQTFYAELKPISGRFQKEALEVNGLDRAWLVQHGKEPTEAMDGAHEWVRNVSGSGHPVFVGYPAPFDWMWLFWYFTKYAREGSPFGFAQCLDIKTLIVASGESRFSAAKPRNLPSNLRSARRHSHHALEDAVSQGETFARLFAESSRPGDQKVIAAWAS
jgi:hypothetical protein